MFETSNLRYRGSGDMDDPVLEELLLPPTLPARFAVTGASWNRPFYGQPGGSLPDQTARRTAH